MAWSIERRAEHVALVTMATNKANAQNPTFFADLHRAFDQLESEFRDCAVVLTSTGRVGERRYNCAIVWPHHPSRGYRRRHLLV
jgi:hypothetical protein